MKRRLALTGALLAAVSLLAACGSGGSSASSSATKVTGGTAVIGMSSQTSPNFFFPDLSMDANSVLNNQVDSLMYLPLIVFNGKSQYNYPMMIASGIQVNASGTVYTVKLNPKWHWSDGTPVTANDVVFTWNVIKAASGTASNLPWIFSGQGTAGIPDAWKSVVALNQHTVQVTLYKPRSSLEFIQEGLDLIFPVPEHVWNKYPNDMMKELAFIKSVSNSPNNAVYKVVDGPFNFQTYQANQYWDFVPNPKFDGQKATISKLVFQYFASDEAEYLALKSGQVNWGYLPISMWADRTQLTNYNMFPSYAIGFNQVDEDLCAGAPGNINKAFSDLAVRQALQLGVDQQGIINTVYHGQAAPDYTSMAEQPPSPLYDSSLKNPYPYDPAKGKKLLEADGWTMQNGVMTKNGVQLSFTLDYVSGAQDVAQTVQILKASWAEEGIQANLVAQPFNQIISYYSGNASKWAMQFWGGGWSFTAYPSVSGIFQTNGGLNVGCWSDPHMDQLINAMNQPGSMAQQTQAIYNFEGYAAKVLPGTFFIPYPANIYEYSKNLHGAKSTYSAIGEDIEPNYWYFTK